MVNGEWSKALLRLHNNLHKPGPFKEGGRSADFPVRSNSRTPKGSRQFAALLPPDVAADWKVDWKVRAPLGKTDPHAASGPGYSGEPFESGRFKGKFKSAAEI